MVGRPQALSYEFEFRRLTAGITRLHKENTLMTYAPAYPHDPIQEIAPHVYMARGSFQMNAMMRISRNMAIVRHERELTLINPIRLSPEGEAQLKALGEVKHFIRLGPFHGIDDPYYKAEFNPEFWCQKGGRAYPEPGIDHALDEVIDLPFANAQLLCFRKTKQPECALLLKLGEGILLTCDAIQHYGDYSHNNLPTKIVMPFIGFPKKTIVGPIWLKFMTPDGGTLQDEFERLLTLKFDTLLSAHGTLLKTGAHAAVADAVARAYGS